MVETQTFQFEATPEKGKVSALFEAPADAWVLLVLGHGAGSHLGHPLVGGLSEALHALGVATFRFNYPYSEVRRGMDTEPVRLATVRAAVREARSRSQLPLFVGGHSMSGRMATLAHAGSPLPQVLGLVCFAFPLHPGAPDAKRAAHLAKVDVPLLFVSGTRDKMADRSLLEGVLKGLAQATLHLLDGADHGFEVLKRTPRAESVMTEAARATSGWMQRVLGAASRSDVAS